MPANPRSLRVTEAFRNRIFAVRSRLERQATDRWPGIEDDFTPWLAATAAATAGAQREAIRATSGYLAAYLTSELGRRAQPPPLKADRYVGIAWDGRPLTEALESPLIGVRSDLADGVEPEEALRAGLVRAVRMVGLDFDHAHRSALMDAVREDERFEDWERLTRGTCGACLALSSFGGPQFPVHPGCACIPQPVVAGVVKTVAVPTGEELFASKTPEEQDASLGPGAAEAVRNGEITLDELVGESRLDSGQEHFLTQAPLGA